MWYHFCEEYKSIMGVEKGFPCNWCDVAEFKCEGVDE